MSDRLDLLDYYTLLGIRPEASVEDVKGAFRTFARRYHPDRYTGGSPEKLARSSQIYRRGSEAYQVLTNPVSRRAYDRVLGVGKLRLSAEDHDRQEKEERLGPKKKAPPIRSPEALALYHQAAEAARRGAWREAWTTMKRALELEPENPLLRARLTQIEGRLRTAR